MKKVLMMLGLMLLVSLLIQGQNLVSNSVILQSTRSKIYTLSFYNGAATFFVIDPDSGQMNLLNVFPEIEGVSAFVATVDSETYRYFQPAVDNAHTQRLLIIDATSGELIASPSFSNTLSVLEYNQKDGYLYGLMYDYDIASNVFVKINPATLELNTLTTVSEVAAVYTGVSGLDIDSNCFFFEGISLRGDEIYKINIQTLEITSTLVSPALLHFAIADNALIGVTVAHPSNHLVRINLLTGESEVIAVVSGIESLYQGASIFDSEKGLYIFPVVDLEHKQRLFIFDIQTGELVAAPELTVISKTTAFVPKTSPKTNALGFSGQLRSWEGWLHYYKIYLPFVVKK